MKIVWRIVWFLLVLALLAGLACLLSLYVPIPWLSNFTTGTLAKHAWVQWAFVGTLGLCAAAALAGMVCVLALPKKHGRFALRRDSGVIEISRTGIESAIMTALAGTEGVKRYGVLLKGDARAGRLKVLIQAQPGSGEVPLADFGRRIQAKVQRELGEYLAIAPKMVQVKIGEVAPARLSSHRAAQPRVL